MQRVPLLYASEGGTAADLAQRVAALGLRRRLHMEPEGFDACLCRNDQEDPVVTLRSLADTCGGVLVLLVSTTGDGEMPQNMRRFWRSVLRRSVPADALAGVQVALYGLGDSGYGHKYCAAARKLDARLQQLGAQLLIPRALADEQHPLGGVLAPFGSWISDLWAALLGRFPLPDGFVVDDSPRKDTPTYMVTRLDAAGPPTDDAMALDPPVDDAESPAAAVTMATASGSAASPAPWSDSYGHAFGLLGLAAPPMRARIGGKQRLTAQDWQQDVRNITITLPSPATGSATSAPGPPPWAAGDVAWVLPENSDEAVQGMLQLVRLKAEDRLILAPRVADEAKGGLAGDMTAGELFGRVLAIQAVPRPFAFEALSLFACDEDEREKLLEIGSAEGADLYHDYCYREKRGWYEVLSDFTSLHLETWDLGHLLDMIPRLQPRAFSIASAPRRVATHVVISVTGEPEVDATLPDASAAAVASSPSSSPSSSSAFSASPPQPPPPSSSGVEEAWALDLCVAVVQYRTRYGRPRRGVCSSWLCAREVGDEVPLWIGPGTFPDTPVSTPMIMIGPGTGVAPMRAFLQQRGRLRLEATRPGQGQSAEQRLSPSLGPPVPDVLFFGCRKQHKDFLYGEEWRELEQRQELRLHAAFSRDQTTKIYVTHRLEEAGKEIWDLLNVHGASVVVAGAAGQMPKDVHVALHKLVMVHGAMESKQADAFLRALEKRQRYCVEAYG